MKYLPKETCEYLVSLGCVSESGMSHFHVADKKYFDQRGKGWVERKDYWKILSSHLIAKGLEAKWIPAFSLEDILRRDNAEKIWAGNEDYRWEKMPRYLGSTLKVLQVFQHNPDTWPEEVAKLIRP